MQRLLAICVVIFCSTCFTSGQAPESTFKPTFKLYGSFQLWTRITELNPGSTVEGQAANWYWDLSVRRYRFGVKGELTPRIGYNLQFGNNSLSQMDVDKPPKLLEAFVTTRLNPYVSITAGKSGWTGLSRYAAPSTSSALGNDTNYAATPLLNLHDDFFRRLSVVVHGQVNRWDYRVVVGKPFQLATTQALSADAVIVNSPQAVHTSAYVKYQFLDKENQSSSFHPWTYHGEKALLNVGAGMMYETQGAQTLSSAGDTLIHPLKSLAADLFYERYQPGLRGALLLYASWLHHNLGPNYIRNLGVNNPADGVSGSGYLNGKGNAFPVSGTGNILLIQTAFTRKYTPASNVSFALQPYFSFQYSRLDGLQDPAVLYETGINYLIRGHDAKITLGYQSRPVFVTGESGWVSSGHRSMAVLQYQIKF